MHDSSIDFIGIGAARSGSTWISECLRQHPAIRLPRQRPDDGELGFGVNKAKKELDFFSSRTKPTLDESGLSHYDKGLAWYFDQFPPAEEGTIRGEFSPIYLHDERSAGLIRATFPDVKLITILRNPVDMIYSLYWLRKNSVELGHGTSFDDAIDEGKFLHRGRYAEQLQRYLELFPKEQIHVMIFDDVRERPEKLVKELYEFLGVRSDFAPTNLHRKINAAMRTKSGAVKEVARTAMSFLNKSGFSGLAKRISESGLIYKAYSSTNIGRGDYQPMHPATRRRLTDYYRSDIEKLEHLIDRDLSAWKE